VSAVLRILTFLAYLVPGEYGTHGTALGCPTPVASITRDTARAHTAAAIRGLHIRRQLGCLVRVRGGSCPQMAQFDWLWFLFVSNKFRNS
jgi:hypothetical protein